MQQQGSNPHPWLTEHTRAVLRDSSWVTIAWDWFQTLLGRAVEAVLWATMIFSCYQLIPGASQPPSQVSSLAFILQFIGLDVGGLGLNKAAQQQGLPRLSYARVIAYILIGITLVTVAYAGIEHAVQMDAQVTAWVEVSLVVARSIMTVLYGQAIHSLKHQGQSSRVRIEELEQEVSTLREQVSSGQSEVSSLRDQVSSLRVQLAQRQHAVDTLSVQVSSLLQQVDSGQAELDRWQQQANGGQQELDSLHQRLQAALSEVDGLRAQLGIRQQELAAVRDAWEREQREVSSLREQLTVQQQQVSSYVPPVDSGQGQVSSQKVSSGRVSRGSVHLDSEHAEVDSGQPAASGQVIHLSSKKQRRESSSEEQVLGERIRGVLQQEPELSARSIASKVGCSPTTAAKWKAIIEREVQEQDTSSRECVND